MTAAIFVLQIVGALASRSLSLLSNAAHLFTDVGALGLALYAAKIGQNRPTEQLSYGYSRGGIVAAFVNGLILAAIAVTLVVTSVFRLFHPVSVNAPIMLIVTGLTLILNLLVTWLLHPHNHNDLNRQGVFWHAIGDTVSSIGILIAATLILVTRWDGWDPLAALLVGFFILWSSYRIARPTIRILMEAAPENTRLDEIRQTFLDQDLVVDVHHLHVWSITPDYHVLSAHVRLKTLSIREGQQIINDLGHMLEQRHNINHTTIQIEADDHDPLNDQL